MDVIYKTHVGLCDSEYYMYADDVEFVHIYELYKTLILFVGDGSEASASNRPVVSISILHRPVSVTAVMQLMKYLHKQEARFK